LNAPRMFELSVTSCYLQLRQSCLVFNHKDIIHLIMFIRTMTPGPLLISNFNCKNSVQNNAKIYVKLT